MLFLCLLWEIFYHRHAAFLRFVRMRFSDIPGNNEVKARLLESVKNGRVAHAQLFLGPEGSANLALALAYASYILCTNKKDNEPCGECKDCYKTTKLIHPDLHFSFPFFKDGEKDVCDNHLETFKKLLLENPFPVIEDLVAAFEHENKQPNITAEECRNIIKKLSFKSLENPYKVLLLWLPEYLGKEGNILLKLIEEPPENTVLLFVCNNEEKLLKTVRSRLQLVKVPRFSDQDILQYLDKKEVQSETAAAAARLSHGNMHEAMAIATHHDTENFEQLKQWLNACNSESRTRMFGVVEDIATTRRENIKQWLHYLLVLLNETEKLQYGTPDLVKITNEEMELVKKLSSRLNIDKLTSLARHTSETIGYIERNSNSKVSLMNLSLTLAEHLG